MKTFYQIEWNNDGIWIRDEVVYEFMAEAEIAALSDDYLGLRTRVVPAAIEMPGRM